MSLGSDDMTNILYLSHLPHDVNFSVFLPGLVGFG